MAVKAKRVKVVTIDRRRDGSMADVYVGAINTLGKFEDMTIKLNTKVEVDENLLKSIKARKETVSETKGKVENLALKPIYTIEVV